MNMNFVFSKSMTLNFVFCKSMNLNFVFSTSMYLNILIKQLANFEFFDSNLTKQMLQFVTGLYKLMLQTFHKIVSSQQKVYDGNYNAARRFEVVFGPQQPRQCTCWRIDCTLNCSDFISLKDFIAF